MVQVTPELIDQAVENGILARAQADELWGFLERTANHAPRQRFTFTNVLYYFGGILAIGAMTLFMTLGWQAFGGWGIFGIAVAYAAIALCGSQFLAKRNLSTPAGILAALAIALVPLAIYGLQHGVGMWPIDRPYRDYHSWIDWRWAVMEVGTLLAGTLVLFFLRQPFAMMPVAVTLWYMSMDFALVFANGNDTDWKFRKLVSMVFGLCMIAIAGYVDVRSRRRPDYAFWLYIFGTLAFWGALSAMDSGSQYGKLIYASINVVLIFGGAIIARRIFTVCGTLGLFGYLGYLSYSVFKDSVMFPIALTAIGLGVVAGGIWWQRHEAAIRTHFSALIPATLRDVVEQ